MVEIGKSVERDSIVSLADISGVGSGKLSGMQPTINKTASAVVAKTSRHCRIVLR